MAEGRRGRVRMKVQTAGVVALAEHEVLEAMLYPYVKLQDTQPCARELLKAHGSIANVLRADENSLTETRGMRKEAAFYLSIYDSVFERVYNTAYDNIVFTCTNDCVRYVRSFTKTADFSGYYVIFMDTNKRLKLMKTYFEVSVKELLDYALKTHAACLLVVKNNKDGDALRPDAEGLKFIKNQTEVLASFDVKILDYVSINSTESISLMKLID